MTGWDQNVVRAFAPAIAAWVTSVIGWLLLEQLQGQPLQAEVASLLRWAVTALLAATLAHGSWISWRLWQQRAA